MKTKNILFLHVPKCAGSSMRHTSLLKNTSAIIHPILRTGAIEKIKDQSLDDYFKCAFVRNPWDRFVSLYFYFYNMKPDHFAYQYDQPCVERIQPYKTFEDFCMNFEEFNHGKFHFFSQSLWTHSNKVCFVDFIGRYENLQNDLGKLESMLSLDVSKLPHKNKSNHLPYQKYYNSKTIDIVGNLYKEDIENFNYDFE
tara:strand:- start:17048 stop:17638 length:591 start_codon:yes stop_codon:yes gene_type:complete